MHFQRHLHRVAALPAALGLGLAVSAPARADQVFADDVIVQGSLCVGVDCVNGENFGFDTVILKENNLRVFFNDTSASGSFPANDWRIVINDTNNGGANYFAVQDATSNGIPFRIKAGANTNSLVVDSDGDIGIKTLSPAVDIHVVEGNTPTLRLEQDGSDGFAAQTWDVAGNEANFFVRDVTHSSVLPFRIKPGTGNDDALFIAANGDVGLGTDGPAAALHVRGTDGSTRMLVEEASGTEAAREMMALRNNGILFLSLEDTSIPAGNNTGRIWNLQNQDGTFRLTTAPGGANEIEMLLDVNGNLTLEGQLFTAGSCSAGCDRVFDADYALPTIDQQAKEMYALGYLPNVGPTPEEGPFNITAMTGGMLNELEKAHIYIAQLHQENLRMAQRLASIETRLETRPADE